MRSLTMDVKPNVDLPVLPPYNEVTVYKSFSCTELEALKSGWIDLVAKSERDIIKIRTRRRT